jgi:hypothetical protein
VIPLGVVAVFWVLTYAMHAYQQPNFRDPGTLSPTGTGRHGASQLAELLQARGVTIVRVTSSADAVAAAAGQDATIFVPAPDYMDGRLMFALAEMSGRHRVVLVKPGLLGQLFSLVPAGVAHSRWATTTAEPACSAEYASRAGVATVLRDSYATFDTGDATTTGVDPRQTADCYRGSVVEFDVPGANHVDLVWVGATEPFRNDRIDEAGNAGLATNLLSADQRVIWLDLHASEVRIPLPQLELPQYGRNDDDRSRNGGDPLLAAFPEQLWVALLLVAAAAVVLALARGRRLGPPVAEPLPVLVPAAEAVLGRGRLYRRIRARAASMATLRSAAIARLARVVDPLTPSPERALATPGPARDAFIGTVASRAGVDAATTELILFGPAPERDDELVRAAATLDALVAAFLSRPRGTTTQPPGGSP